MKYKKLFTDDEFHNEDGLIFQKEFEDLIAPFIKKYMLLNFASKDMEFIMLRAIAYPMAALMMKRINGIEPFDKKEEKK
jgi:hypothetical protein